MRQYDRHLKYLLALADIGNNHQPGVTDISAPRNQDVLQSFVLHCQAKGVKSKSLRDYIHRLSYLVNYANSVGKSLVALNRADIEAHLSTIIGAYSAVTVNGRITIWKMAYSYWAEEGYVPASPMERICRIKEEQQIKPVLNAEQLRLLLNCFDTKTFAGTRNRLMVQTVLDTAVRVGELVSIQREDCHLSERIITLRHTKAYKDRNVPISPTLAKGLFNWNIRWRRGLPGDRLFCRDNGTPISRDRLRKVLVAVKDRVGVKNLGPHALRRTSVCLLHQGGFSVEMCRRLLGHADIRTTQTYIQSNGFEGLQEAHDRHSVLRELGVA